MAAPGVSIDIRGCMTALDNEGREFVVFAIYICLGPYAWTVYRRYSEFRALYDLLAAHIEGLSACPPKHPARGGALTRDVLEIRRCALLQWIRTLAKDENVCCSPVFHNFLRQNANRPPPSVVPASATAAGASDSGSTATAATEPASAAGTPHGSTSSTGPAASSSSSSATGAVAGTKATPVISGAGSRGVGGEGSGKLKVSLGDFTLVKVIGKGSFGKVMLASKRDSDRVYAIKVLSKSVVAARNQVDHTVTERAVMGRIAHPFIVGLKYAFQTQEKLYFVLDFCPGGELFYHLGKEGRFHEGRAKFYTAQILLALEHIHSIGVVYRDLKPENVLLDADGNVKITDFGLSKEGVTAADSGASSFCGTPEYLAPEVLNRTGHGRAVDWWSLGALLFEMLTGWPPFYSTDRKELFDQIRHSDLDLRDAQHLSEAARDILRRLLHKDPKQRLGCSAADSADIKAHPFFTGVDWGALLRREIPAPWRPAVTGPADTRFFSSEFTDMAVDTDSTSAEGGAQWGGFSFVARDSSMAARAGVAMPGAAARVAMPVLAAMPMPAAIPAAPVGAAAPATLSSSSSSSSASATAYSAAMAVEMHAAAMPAAVAVGVSLGRGLGKRILSEDVPDM